jgi:hypothetical protein
MGNDIIINPIYGLGNRLMALWSAVRLAAALKRTLKICWLPDTYSCNADFRDLFAGVPWEFVSEFEMKKYPELPYEYLFTRMPDETFYMTCCHWFHYRGINNDFSPEIRFISPLPDLQGEIDRYSRDYDLKKRTGVHIRKGDKCKLNCCETRQEPHLVMAVNNAYIEAMSRTEGDFFVSSDENLSLYKFLFGPRIITREIEDRSRDLPGLREAVVDMWLLARTKRIIRGLGSFGMCASAIGRVPGSNIFKSGNRDEFTYLLTEELDYYKRVP